jgi:hypothetical protein
MQRLLLLVAITAASLTTAGIASAAPIHHCANPPVGSTLSNRGGHAYGYYIVGDLTTRNMTCSAAIRGIKNGRETRGGGLSTPGFACRIVRAYHAGGVTTGAVINCAAGRRHFQFSWAT